MYLLIVESPSKCQKIMKYLGPGYHCMASCGHINYIQHLKDIDVDNNFNVNFSDLPAKIKYIKKIREYIKKHHCEVIIATDDDREGEAIGYHLCNKLNLDKKSTKRIVFNEITKSALIHAVNNPIRIRSIC